MYLKNLRFESVSLEEFNHSCNFWYPDFTLDPKELNEMNLILVPNPFIFNNIEKLFRTFIGNMYSDEISLYNKNKDSHNKYEKFLVKKYHLGGFNNYNVDKFVSDISNKFKTVESSDYNCMELYFDSHGTSRNRFNRTKITFSKIKNEYIATYYKFPSHLYKLLDKSCNSKFNNSMGVVAVPDINSKKLTSYR